MMGLALFLALSLLPGSYSHGRLRLSPSEETAKIRFSQLKTGIKVKSPIKLRFRAKSFSVVAAGKKKYNGGHYHLLVDTPLPKNRFLPLPRRKTIVHLDSGGRETTIRLRRGKHKLQLVMGDHRHIPHNPMVISKVIEITVE